MSRPPDPFRWALERAWLEKLAETVGLSAGGWLRLEQVKATLHVHRCGSIVPMVLDPDYWKTIPPPHPFKDYRYERESHIYNWGFRRL